MLKKVKNSGIVLRKLSERKINMGESFFRGLLVDNISSAQVILTSISYDEGCSCGKGASLAPITMRELSSYLPPLTINGETITTKIFDNGDCTKYNEIENLGKKVFFQNKFSLFFGGDHSVTIPLQKAFYDYEVSKNNHPVIIHIDAHPDICDIYEDNKLSHACTNRRALEHGYHDEDIIMIGIRGYEQQEVDFFNKHPNIKVYQASYINEHGIETMLEEIINKYHNKVVYLSYDIDANDPGFAPGTGTPEAFGLSSNLLMKVITTLYKKLNIKAMDIVEVSPPLDVNNITSWLALKTLYEILPLLKENK